MYCQFFELERMPFDNTPDPRFFFTTPEHDEALAALRYGVTQRRGFTVVTGRPGSGKTLLGHMLVRSLGPQALTAIVSHTPEDAHDLIASLSRGLGLRCRMSHSTGELVERLHSSAVTRFHEERLVVAIIDEAQNLSRDVLEHLRMLGNLEQDTAKLLQIVLLGQAELVPLLRDPCLDQLRQRIFCSRRINPLGPDQAQDYILHRLRIAGAKDPAIFTDQAVDLIYEKSGGIPRLINQIADNSLLTAYGASLRTVEREVVAESIEQMMDVQLGRSDQPAPVPSPQAHTEEAVQPVGTLPPSAPVAPDNALTETLVCSLNEGVRAAAQVAGRLQEISRGAKEQLAELSDAKQSTASLMATTQTAKAVTEAAEQSTSDLGRAVADARSLTARIEQTVASRREQMDRFGVQVDRAIWVAGTLKHLRQQAERTRTALGEQGRIPAPAAGASVAPLDRASHATMQTPDPAESSLGPSEVSTSDAADRLNALARANTAAEPIARALRERMNRFAERVHAYESVAGVLQRIQQEVQRTPHG